MTAPTAAPKAPTSRGRAASLLAKPQAAAGDDDDARAAAVAPGSVAVHGIERAALIRRGGAAHRPFAFHEDGPTNDLLHPNRS